MTPIAKVIDLVTCTEAEVYYAIILIYPHKRGEVVKENMYFSISDKQILDCFFHSSGSVYTAMTETE